MLSLLNALDNGVDISLLQIVYINVLVLWSIPVCHVGSKIKKKIFLEVLATVLVRAPALHKMFRKEVIYSRQDIWSRIEQQQGLHNPGESYLL